MSADELDILIEYWASTYLLGDRQVFASLSYPPSTNVHKFVQRGGFVVRPDAALTPSLAQGAAVDRVDRAMANLRLTHERWYMAVVSRYVLPGPDESRARRLSMGMNAFDRFLYSGRRYLRRQLLAAPVV